MQQQLLRCFLFGLFCLTMTSGSAQSDSIWDRRLSRLPNAGISTYCEVSKVNYPPNYGEMVVGFQYQIDNTQHVFTDTINGLKKGSGTFPSFGVVFYHHNFGLDLAVCPFYIRSAANKWNAFAGITYRFRYEKVVPSMADMVTDLNQFPISVTLGVQNYNAIFEAGSIRIDSTERFKAFGADLGLSEDEPEYGYVHVDVQNRTFAFVPSLNIGYRPRIGYFQLQFRFAAFIPFSSKTGLSFYYKDSDADDHASFPRGGVIPFRGYGVHATYNGGPVPENPYPISGWMFSVRVEFGGDDVFQPYRGLWY